MSLKRKFKKPHVGQVVWIFPIFAVILTGFLFYEFWRERGPMVEILFPDASSIEPQKTPVKFRGISVGKVEDLKLSKDSKQVVVYVRLTRNAAHFAVEGTSFSIIQPEVGFEGVSGLETIFKGPYLRVQPGSPKAKKKLKFTGGSGVDVTENSAATISYTLTAPIVDSTNPGDQVTYRGLKVGAVTSVDLAKGSQGIDIKISVDKKFVKLIRDNTVFWKKKAVKADLGLFGSEFEIGSFETLMKGGIALATPNEAAKIANAQSTFPLQEDAPKDWKTWAPKL